MIASIFHLLSSDPLYLQIEVQKLNWKAESKVGSLKNATHSPGGGNVKVR